ncbi:MAG: hypothetical protein LKJ47_04935 [Bifidobacteriaceae bacterium]|nr:hypothetical protein [Bifidobacteriaceae bacterium]
MSTRAFEFSRGSVFDIQEDERILRISDHGDGTFFASVGVPGLHQPHEAISITSVEDMRRLREWLGTQLDKKEGK